MDLNIVDFEEEISKQYPDKEKKLSLEKRILIRRYISIVYTYLKRKKDRESKKTIEKIDSLIDFDVTKILNIMIEYFGSKEKFIEAREDISKSYSKIKR